MSNDNIRKLYYSDFDGKTKLKVKLIAKYGRGYIALVLPDNKKVRFSMFDFEDRNIGTTHNITKIIADGKNSWNFSHAV